MPGPGDTSPKNVKKKSDGEVDVFRALLNVGRDLNGQKDRELECGLSGRKKKKDAPGQQKKAGPRLYEKPPQVAQRRHRADEIEHPSDEQKERFNHFIAEILVVGIDGLLKDYETELKGYYTPNIRRTAFDRNPNKNRYKDVVCLDHSRVVLQGKEGDYIHANHVRGEPLINNFICTQGPLASTCVDFWRMVVQEHVGNIFMLCQVEELGKKKSEQYWPNVAGAQKVYGAYTIHCTAVDSSDKRIVHTSLRVEENGKEVCSLKHYQWIDWPDRSVPHSLLAVFRLLRFSRNSRFTTVVHCSAGIGRTGAFVAIEMILQRSVSSDSVKMVNVVKQLRGMRASAVQTDMQYVYLAMSIVNYCKEVGIMKSSFFEAFNRFKESYESLAQKRLAEEEAKMRGMANDMEIMERHIEEITKELERWDTQLEKYEARKEENIEKLYEEPLPADCADGIPQGRTTRILTNQCLAMYHGSKELVRVKQENEQLETRAEELHKEVQEVDEITQELIACYNKYQVKLDDEMAFWEKCLHQGKKDTEKGADLSKELDDLMAS